ncbi:hypothetical protein ILYODFUR_032645 [Ilyodon furcidens]|uniref:Secreted protein n=1 Tax=Ilyodon furcidens TaxID=33524 RepID=A0ABV0TRB6_9TELE
MQGCMVVQLVTLLPCSKKFLGVRLPAGGLSAWSLHVLTGYSGFLPQSKNVTVRLTGLSTLPLGVNVCVCGCLSCVCVLPCDGLPTCPGCTPPPAHGLLDSFPMTHYGRSGRK